MKNIIRIIIVLSVLSFPYLIFGQALGTYEVRCVGVSHFQTSDEGGLGLPDVTWKLDMKFLDKDGAPISDLLGQCFHVDESPPLLEYNPGPWYLTTTPYSAQPCGTKVSVELIMTGFEKDFIPNNCDYDIFDDFGRIATLRFPIGSKVDQPDIWYPYEFIVRSQTNDPLYKFKFEFKYTIDVMDGGITEAHYSDMVIGLPMFICEDDVYRLKARTHPGSNGFFKWERRVFGSMDDWSPHLDGFGLREISVQATEPVYHYKVQVVADDGLNCLADTTWQYSPTPPAVNKRPPLFYEVEAFTKPACGMSPSGSITLLPYNYTPTGAYEFVIVKLGSAGSAPSPSTTFPVTFNNLDSGYYKVLITRAGDISGQCTSEKDSILVTSAVVPMPSSISIEPQQCSDGLGAILSFAPQQNTNPYFVLDTFRLTGPIPASTVQTQYAYRNVSAFGDLAPGTYSLTAERHGCSSAPTFHIVPSAPDPITATVTVIPAGCAGENGMISVSSIVGGIPFPNAGFDYLVDLSGYYTDSVEQSGKSYAVSPGMRTMVISDANGCVKVFANIMIPASPSPPTFSFAITNPNGCGVDGSVTVSGSGGTPPYEYSLNQVDWQPDSVFSGLSPGGIHVYMRDDVGCEALGQWSALNAPGMLTSSIFQTAETCADSSMATITSNQNGGVPPYLIELFEQGNATALQTVPSTTLATYEFLNLPAGPYMVRVTDSDPGTPCTNTSSIVLRELAVPMIEGIDDSSPKCFISALPPIRVEVSGRSFGSPVNNLEVSIDGGPFTPTSIVDYGATAFHSFTPPALDGTYVLRDVLGCPVDVLQSFDRTRPDEIVVTIISVDSASCQGVFDGSITGTVVGAVKPFKIALFAFDGDEIPTEFVTIESTEEDTITFSNLQAANGYYLRVTDNLQNPNIVCSARSFPSTTVYAPAELLVTGVAQAQLLDCKGRGGAILASATGGTPPYQYSLDRQYWQTSPLLTNAIDSNVVYVRDAHDCQAVTFDQIYIGFAPVPIMVNSILTSSGSECTPQRDSIVLDGIDQGFYVNGFSVLWNNCSGSTIPAMNDEKDLIIIKSIGSNYLVVENLIQNIIPVGCDTVVEGVMIFTVIDSNECTADITVPIKVKNRQPRLNIINKMGVTCSGDMDGSVTVRVIDSLFDAGDAGSFRLSPPFLVTLNNETPQMVTFPPYEITFTGVAESGYTISVEGSESCASFILDSIGRLSPYDLTVVNTAVTACGTDSTGGLSVTINGGSNLPYMWTWYSDADMSFDPLGPTETLNTGESTTLSNLPVTTIRAIISDNNACVDTLDFSILGPNILSLSKSDSTNLTCNNGADGSASVNFVGGTVPVQYSIDGMAAQSDSFFTGLSAGPHTVVVIDFNGCQDSVQFNLIEPAAIIVDDITITNVNCFGEPTGRIQLTASSGIGALEYALDAGTYQPLGDFPGLAAGFYNVTIRDANLCTLDTMNIEVTQPTLLTSSIAIFDSLTCVQNATLVATGVGGTVGYAYSWNGGISLTDTLMNAGIGQHIVRITDSLGCMVLDTITLAIPNSPILSLAADTADACNQSNGSFLVVANDGAMPYTFTTNGQNNNTGYFAGLVAMNYVVLVTDIKGCMDTLMVQVDSIGGPQITQIDSTQTTCAGDNGTITLTIANGTVPYQYTWSHDAGLNANTAIGLGIGSYQVTVTDARQCTVVEMIEITETAPPVLSVIQEVNSACGQDNGMAIVSATGGNPGYGFSWSHDNTITGPSASNLAPATYLVIVTDQNSCKDSVNVVITEDPPPTISVADSVDESCGLANGSITLTTNGDNPTSFYTWSHNGGILDSMASNLSAGTYGITVTDSRGCVDSIMVILTNSAGPSISLIQLRDNQCPSGNGLIRLTSTGGSLPAGYTWSHDNTLTDSVATDLLAGPYDVTVTDQNNCSETMTYTVMDDNLLSATVTDVQPTGCDTASGAIEILANGGQADYTYTWSHDMSLDTNYVDSLPAGSYTVTVTDMLGCSIEIDTIVGSTTGPTIMLVSSTNSYCGPGMGSAIVSASGGAMPYTFEWSHDAAVTDSFATGLSGGGINVVVRDANNCTSMTSFVITQTTPIVLSLDSIQNEQCEANDGLITVSRSGGTPPLTYTWSHNAGLNNPSATNLTSGSYSVTVTDNVGCVDTLSAVVDSIASPMMQLTASQNNACDQANGFIQTATVGGTPAFTFSWSHDTMLNSSDATNLIGGTYTVTVTDANACFDILTTTIIDDPILVVTEVSVTPTGCAANDGMIVSGVNGGNGTYTYSWSHDAGLTDSIASNLAAGSYTLTVSDALGCMDSIMFTVTQSGSPMVSLNSSQQNECGTANGQIIVDVSNGSAPYNYTWSHDATLNDSIATNLLDGMYTVTVTDGNGCTDTLDVTLTCFTTLSLTVTDTTHENCGQANGSMAINVSGGSSPYTYTWSHDATLNSPTATGLAAGTYSVTVTDVPGDMITYSYEILNLPGAQLTLVSAQNNTCPNPGNGSITVSGSGGTSPYTYMWSHDGTIVDSMAAGLVAGSYTVIVTDGNGCMDTITNGIIDENLLTASVSEVTETSCIGSTGSISIMASLGSAPYAYSWSHDVTVMDSFAVNLPAGPYTITISDGLGCMVTIDTVVVQANAPSLTIADQQNSTCDLPNGSARVTPSGGTSPYTYVWSHDVGLTDSIASDLSAGDYMVTVTDANMCSDLLTITIDGSPAVVLTAASQVDETCGLANGSIALSNTGGTGPFTYDWSHDAMLNNDTATNLSAGLYSVIITDALGCMDALDVTLNNIAGPQVSLVSSQNDACTQSNGEIVVGVTNGTLPYTYTWSHDGTLNDSIANGLAAGTYNLTVTDGNNCASTLSQSIGADPILNFMVASNSPASCGLDTGRIVISGSGGLYPYQYNWSHDAMLNDSVANNLSAGVYTVTVTDSRNCQLVLSSEIISSDGPQLALAASIASSCDLPNGSARVEVIGGQSPYTYAWSHDANLTDSIAMDLAEGMYQVTLTDANGCGDTLSINIGGSPAVALNTSSAVNESCGLSNGSIALSNTGGTGPFTYAWSHDAMLNNDTATNLSAGLYSVIITDALGCMDTLDVTLNNIAGPQVSLVSSQNDACAQSNGEIIVGVTNGTLPYTYTWSHDGTLNDSIANGLAAGTYNLTVTDGNNCASTLSQIIGADPVLNFMVASNSPASCGLDTGRIVISGSGGLYPYQYNWSHDAMLNDSVANNLSAGVYTVTVTDSRNCQLVLSSEIISSDGPQLALAASIASSCDLPNGSARVEVIGGQSPYTYAWSHDANLTDSIAMDLAEGTYQVTLTDANGCGDTLSINIGGSPAVTLSLNSTTPAMCGQANGSITVLGSAGTGPYTYTWSHDASLNTNMALNLIAGMYQIIIEDAMQCRDTLVVGLPGSDRPSMTTVSSEDNTCAQANGLLTVGVTGGMVPYSYTWSHDAALMDSIASNLSAGDVTVIVIDANGCADTLIHTVIDGPQLSVTVVQIDSSNCEPGTGSITIAAVGGSGAYTYSWSHDNTLNNNVATGLVAGAYSVTVTDARGCMVDLNADVPQFDGPTFANVNVQPSNCNDATGSIELFPVGGLPPYSYIWSHDPLLNAPLAGALTSGIYEYQVTDARNCTAVGFATVGSSVDIDISLVSATMPACAMDNGLLEISVTGGMAPYMIQWFDANDLTTVIGTDLMINNLAPATYVVMVMDVNGCVDQNSYILNELENMNVLLSAIDETCPEANDGSAIATLVSGGTAPFNYVWNDASTSTSPTISPVEAGIYSVTITDGMGCQFVDSVEVKQPIPLSIDTLITASGCDNAASGSIFVTANGGVPPYTYLWPLDAVNNQSRTDLAAGVYTLLLIDSTGCQDTFNIEVPNADDITVTAGDIVLPACDGSSGGSATVEVVGGQSPYMFAWNDGLNQSTQTATNLPPGSYQVTVTDQGGCSDTLSMEIPNQQGLTISEIDLMEPTCNGDQDGEIEIGVAGGSGNYSFIWDDPLFQTTARATGLGAGRYIVVVMDLDLGCINQDTFFLTNPPALMIDSFTTMHVSCFGEASGSSQVHASGGSGDLNYVWNDAMNQITDLVTGLSQGVYQVTVTDENFCSAVGEVTVEEPDEIAVSVIDSASISCFGAADGRIKVAVDGGTSPYTIYWPELDITGDSVANLEAVLYTVQITDDNGCMTEQMVGISEPNAISIELIDLMNPACSDAQLGMISVNATGGTGVLQYQWNDDLMQITPTAFNLDTGTYIVQVTDENMCTDTMSFNLTGQSGLLVELIDSITPLCFGDQNGSLGVQVTGGNDDYIYLWDDPSFQVNATAINLASGEYVLFTSNGDGTCPTYDTLFLNQPAQLNSVESAVIDANCFGEANGSIVLDVSGGTEPYQLDWAEIGMNLGDSVTMLTAGTYHVEINDMNGCMIFDTIEIQEPADLIISPLPQDPLCFNDQNGSIDLNVTGGTLPYQYIWAAPLTDTTAQINNLIAGNYFVTVSDQNGCRDTSSVVLSDQSSEINLEIIELLEPSCAGADNGVLSVSASGGSGALQYQWSNGIMNPLNDMLLPDIYNVTITDGLGCSIDSMFDLSQVSNLEIDLGFTDTIICQGQTISFGANSIPGGIYSWTGPDLFTSTDSTISVSAPGTYSVTVNASVCSDDASVEVINSADVLQTHFILPTQIVVDDTIVVLQRTWPIPDAVSWTFDSDSVIFVGQNLDQWIYTFPYAGQFDIGLSAEIGNCNSFISKTITVHPDSSFFVVPQSQGNKQILSFAVSPNPSSGFFMANFDLQFSKPYYLRIYQIDGTPVENRQGTGAGPTAELFNFSGQANGLYIVALQSEDELVWSILKIQRP